MKAAYRLATVAAGIMAATGAQAQVAAPTITVIPWVAPNLFGSPSFQGAEVNQFNAVRAGASSAGTPGTPTYYEAISGPIAYGNIIATNFNSWKGTADPGAPFGSELGNRIHYGLFINGNGSQFSISQLSLAFDGNGTGDPFDVDFGTGYQYSPYDGVGGYVGILRGTDGQLGTGDDVFITAGADTQQVDALIGRGSGMADAVYCGAVPDTSGPCGPANQSYIDAEIATLQGLGFDRLTANYRLLNQAGGTLAAGSGTVTFVAGAVPEPATWAMMIGGFGFVGAAMRRRATATRVRFA